MRGALLGSLIGAGADVLGGLGIDQCLEHQGEPLADQVEVPAGTQCIQQLGQGRLAEGHRGELLGVNLGRITLSFTRWPSPCYSAGQGPASKSTTSWDAYLIQQLVGYPASSAEGVLPLTTTRSLDRLVPERSRLVGRPTTS